MIKKTFYNLPQEKKDRILQAVREEFKLVPREKVSINRIVARACISRGSFYQYFDDKVDLVVLITEDLFEYVIMQARELLQKNDGNLFLMYIDLFDIITDYIADRDEQIFFSNIFESFKTNGDLITDFLQHRFPQYECEKIVSGFAHFVNTNYLKYHEQEDIACIINIMNLVERDSVFDVFVLGVRKEEAKKTLYRKILLLKNGFASDTARENALCCENATGSCLNGN